MGEIWSLEKKRKGSGARRRKGRYLLTYHIAGDLGRDFLGERLVRLADGGLAGAGGHAEQAVQVVDGDALAGHGGLEGVVGRAIGGHFVCFFLRCLALLAWLVEVVRLVGWFCREIFLFSSVLFVWFLRGGALAPAQFSD